MKDWERFVLEHGRMVRCGYLAAVLGQPMEEIYRVRRTGACTKGPRKGFAELFSLWHGRPPADDEWPAPSKSLGGGGAYEWQAPELALLASLVGRLDKRAIAKALTKRLRELTGDKRARRDRNAVQIAAGKIGLQFNTDVVGGIALREAAREIGSYEVVHRAIRRGELAAFRVGRPWVIPHAAWEAFKTSRVLPPKGYMQLSTLRQALGFRSDAKLPDYAKRGHIPTAILCDPPASSGAHWSGRGTWFIAPNVAAKLVADRRAGRPMPWWGKGDIGNLRVTFKLWQKRKHPAACRTCAEIWGRFGAPRTFEDYVNRYVPIAHGAKRHLTREWAPGLTVNEVAGLAGRSVPGVHAAIRNGVLPVTRIGRSTYVSKTDATRWKFKGGPSGESHRSWASFDNACKQYGFKKSELRAFIAEGKLRSKVGTYGAQRGVKYVMLTQCGQLREKIGFTEEEAARRVGVSVPRFRVLLKGVDWRAAAKIPLVTVQAVIKRFKSKAGYTIEEAAAKLRTSVQWVHERKLDGTIRLSRAKWDRRRFYITEPMLERLRQAKRKPVKRERFTSSALLLSQAAREAGVCTTMICRWAADGELRRQRSRQGWRYHRSTVRIRARRHWKTQRLRRAVPPAWLQAEREQRRETQ